MIGKQFLVDQDPVDVNKHQALYFWFIRFDVARVSYEKYRGTLAENRLGPISGIKRNIVSWMIYKTYIVEKILAPDKNGLLTTFWDWQLNLIPNFSLRGCGFKKSKFYIQYSWSHGPLDYRYEVIDNVPLFIYGFVFFFFLHIGDLCDISCEFSKFTSRAAAGNEGFDKVKVHNSADPVKWPLSFMTCVLFVNLEEVRS